MLVGVGVVMVGRTDGAREGFDVPVERWDAGTLGCWSPAAPAVVGSVESKYLHLGT